MVGHDAPGFKAVVDAIAAKPEPDSEYWRVRYVTLYEAHIELKHYVRKLETWLRINDMYFDSANKQLRELQKLMSEIACERVKA